MFFENIAVQDGTVELTNTTGVVAGNMSTSDTPSNFIVLNHTPLSGAGPSSVIQSGSEGSQSGGYKSYYWHLNAVYVTEGQVVKKGDVIGLSGNTGYLRGNPDMPTANQGCHLHFEIRKADDTFAVNPLHILNTMVDPATLAKLKETYFKGIDDASIVNNTEFGTGESGNDPYGTKTYKDLSNFSNTHITIQRDLNGNIQMKDYYLPPPEITKILVTPDRKNASVYGIALPNIQVKIKIEQKKNCDWNPSCLFGDYDTIETNQTLNYMGVSLYANADNTSDIDTSDRNQFGYTGVSDSTGRWSYTFRLDDVSNHNVNIGDSVTARTKGWMVFTESINGKNVLFDFTQASKTLVSANGNIKQINEVADETLQNSIEKAEEQLRKKSGKCSDVKGMYDVCMSNKYAPYIKSLIDNNIVSGDRKGNFNPKDFVTRGQMSKFIKSGFNVQTNTSCKSFKDVSTDNTFYTEIMSLRCANIVGGYSDGNFKSDAYVKRSEVSKFIVNSIEFTNKMSLAATCSNSEIDDVKPSNTFYPYIVKLKCAGVIKDAVSYRPDDNLTRGEMAMMVDLARKYIISMYSYNAKDGYSSIKDNKLNENGVDFDGVAGIQCVDLVRYYLESYLDIESFYFKGGCANSGFSNHQLYPEIKKPVQSDISILKNVGTTMNGYKKYHTIIIDDRDDMEKGDIVFLKSEHVCGHVGIFTGEQDDNGFSILNQNWGDISNKKLIHISYIKESKYPFTGAIRIVYDN